MALKTQNTQNYQLFEGREKKTLLEKYIHCDSFFSERMDLLLQKHNQDKTLKANTLAHDYLNTLSNTKQDDEHGYIKGTIKSQFNYLNSLGANLPSNFCIDQELDNYIPKVKNHINDLAELVVSRNSNENSHNQMDKLDQLWDLKRHSLNDETAKLIQATMIRLTNAIYSYINKEPGSSQSKIAELENQIANLYTQMI